MADDLIAAELDVIRERERNATPAPWGTEEDEDVWKLFGALDTGLHPLQLIKAPKHDPRYAEYWPGEADEAFIVHARADVPRLLAALDAVLELHAPTATTRYTEACAAHAYRMLGRLECPDCRKVQRNGCQTCRDEFGNPAKPEDCKERAAILAALIVKGKNSDGA